MSRKFATVALRASDRDTSNDIRSQILRSCGLANNFCDGIDNEYVNVLVQFRKDGKYVEVRKSKAMNEENRELSSMFANLTIREKYGKELKKKLKDELNNPMKPTTLSKTDIDDMVREKVDNYEVTDVDLKDWYAYTVEKIIVLKRPVKIMHTKGVQQFAYMKIGDILNIRDEIPDKELKYILNSTDYWVLGVVKPSVVAHYLSLQKTHEVRSKKWNILLSQNSSKTKVFMFLFIVK